MDTVNLRIDIVASIPGAPPNTPPAWEHHEAFNGLSYADFVKMQGILHQAAGGLIEMGKANVAARSGPGQKS